MKEKIVKFISDNLINLDDEIEIKDEDNIFEKGFVNSLFSMKLLNYIETEFNMQVDDDDMEISNFSTVNRIEALIKKKTEVLSD